MTSPSEKGTKIELIAVKHLQAQGYVVHRCVRTPKWRGSWISASNDIFGCIDIIAKKQGERMRYIQVLSNGAIGAKKAKLAVVPWDADRESVEIWRWVDGSGKRKLANGKERPRLYFQAYRLERSFALDKSDRIWPRST